MILPAGSWRISKVSAAVWAIICLLAPWWTILSVLMVAKSFPIAMGVLVLAALFLWVVFRPIRGVGRGWFLAIGVGASIAVVTFSYAALMLVIVIQCAQDCRGWP